MASAKSLKLFWFLVIGFLCLIIKNMSVKLMFKSIFLVGRSKEIKLRSVKDEKINSLCVLLVVTRSFYRKKKITQESICKFLFLFKLKNLPSPLYELIKNKTALSFLPHFWWILDGTSGQVSYFFWVSETSFHRLD